MQTALLHERQLEVRYRFAEVYRGLLLRLHPLGLVQRGPVTYLVATAFAYTDVRLYAMHRIQAATITDEPVSRPDVVELDDYLAGGALQFGSGATLWLKVRLSVELAAILEEAPLAPDQMILHCPMCVLLTVTMPASWQLWWWILSQGAGIEVLAPEVLLEEIGHQLCVARTYYDNDISSGGLRNG